MEGRLVFTTYPNEREAEKIVRDSIQAKAAACANMIRIRSIYTWKGNVEDTEEVLVMFKTSEKAVNALRTLLLENHPYEVPEILEINPNYINLKYIEWLAKSLR